MMNLPNKLSLIRIGMVPAFLLVLYFEIPDADNSIVLAAIIFMAASITDAADGYIARRYDLSTDFGKFIDPLADKILVVSALIYLVGAGIIPGWMVIIIVGRDFAVSGIRMMASGGGKVISASIAGKIKTNVQIAAVLACLLQYRPDVGFIDAGTLWEPWYWWLMLVAVGLTIYSGAEYIWLNRKLIKEM